MRNTLAHIKTLILFSAIAFAGHVLAAPETWFSGTANGEALDADLATWDTNVVGEVTVAADVLSIDLPTNTVVKLTPSDHADKDNKKTCVVVDDAVFTPTAYNDIDSTVVEGAQTALTVAYDGNPLATNYYAYIGGTWKKLGGSTPGDAAVDVTIELDYSKPAETNVSFKVGNDALYDATDTDVTSFPISGEHRYLGRIELAGYGKIHSITTTVYNVSPIEIVPGKVEYGADFTNVTITATITGGAGDDAEQASYTLAWGGGSYALALDSHEGTEFKFIASIPPPSGVRDSVAYTISATGSAVGMSASTQTFVADIRDWILEDSTHTRGIGTHTGTWSNDVTYADSVAAVSYNTYTANNCSTGDYVTITFENLHYSELSDLSVETPAGTQGAFALAETNLNNQVSTNFCVLAKKGENYIWVAADCSIAATTDVDYTVVMTFVYVSNKYSVSVDGYALSVGGATQFDICVTKTAVTDFVFKGNGTLSSIKGEEFSSYMAKDDTSWYVTVQQAITSGNSGPFTILRDTDTTAEFNGWKFVIEGGVTKLKKLAKGLFFMAY